MPFCNDYAESAEDAGGNDPISFNITGAVTSSFTVPCLTSVAAFPVDSAMRRFKTGRRQAVRAFGPTFETRLPPRGEEPGFFFVVR